MKSINEQSIKIECFCTLSNKLLCMARNIKRFFLSQINKSIEEEEEFVIEEKKHCPHNTLIYVYITKNGLLDGKLVIRIW